MQGFSKTKLHTKYSYKTIIMGIRNLAYIYMTKKRTQWDDAKIKFNSSYTV